MLKEVLLPLGTLLFGVVTSQVFNVVKHIEWKKEFAARQLDRQLGVLREAFLSDKNDKYSRIDAYNEYKKLGGGNYATMLQQLKKLPND